MCMSSSIIIYVKHKAYISMPKTSNHEVNTKASLIVLYDMSLDDKSLSSLIQQNLS